MTTKTNNHLTNHDRSDLHDSFNRGLAIPGQRTHYQNKEDHGKKNNGSPRTNHRKKPR